ncbi:BglG family transcription antiterminator [Pontibacillus salicampi]|uniref:BglG family transcription antiterminator n=1 Tax=Pontibacillus salicampi TaxID=1449801 RepID=A0ABV6LI35_9BACI
MNVIQTKILLFLLSHANQYVLIQVLAKKFHCSEKTIRNHLKRIEAYLQSESFQAEIIRKPGFGIYLNIQQDYISQLYKHLSKINHEEELDEAERRIQITYKLLMETKAITMKGLSAYYFVSKSIIKKDIEAIQEWLAPFQLSLASKQRIGLVINGTEKNKRAALARLTSWEKNGDSGSLMMEQLFDHQEIVLVRQALQSFQHTYDIPYADETVEGLILHILLTIKRIKLHKTMVMSEDELATLKQQQEYGWASELVRSLEKPFVVHFPEAEIAYITLHIRSGRLRYGTHYPSFPEETTEKLSLVSNHLIGHITTIFGFDFSSDDQLKNGLHTHLETTLKRLEYGFSVPNPMLENIKQMYPYLFDQIVFSLDEIKDALAVNIPEEEAAYLVLHFQASIERFSSSRHHQVNTLIVCHMGMGMSQLLRTKIERQFPMVQVIASIAKADVAQYIQEHTIDCIVSTTELTVHDIPTIVVSPLLERKDTERLQHFFKNPKDAMTTPKKESILLQYTSPFLVYLDQPVNHRFTIIEQLARKLSSKGYVKPEYMESCIQREQWSSTNIGGFLAIPHGSPQYVNQSSIAIATLEEPIDWGTGKVKMVCLLGMKYKSQEEARQLFEELSTLSESPSLIQALTQSNDVMTFLSSLQSK